MNQKTNHLNPDIYQSLFELGNNLLRENDINKLLSMTMDRVIEISGAERGWIMLFNEQHPDKPIQVMKNIQNKDIENAGFKVNRMIIEKVKTEGSPVWLPNDSDVLSYQRQRFQESEKTYSIICLPLIHNNSILGILYLDHLYTPEGFTSEIFEAVQEVVHFFSIALHSFMEGKQLHKLVKNLKKATVKYKKVIE